MADLLRRLETEKRLLDSLSEYVILIGVVQKDTTRKKVVASGKVPSDTVIAFF